MSAFPILRCWLLGVSLITACSLTSDRPPLPARHDFGPAVEVGSKSLVHLSTIEIDAPEWLDDDRIRYRLLYADPTRVRYYSRDRWVSPPPALLAERLGTALNGQGYHVRIRLLDFEQVFDSPARANAVLRFRATAYIHGNNQPAADQVFHLSRSTPSADAAGAVTTLAELVDSAIVQLRAWVPNFSARD